ncbi:hypothetical protein [Candidatus Amarobacter glycogenicus]|uniref:hypothetical protein n=1 Tax=Candidatus Amarobacter glycogenicus TaxID=3140699 RepID=UPI003136FCE1|nr:hypothetical protein [Dehalococcoidia bacterium]
MSSASSARGRQRAILTGPVAAGLLAVLVSALALTAPARDAASAEALTNGGFESWGGTNPTGWSATGGLLAQDTGGLGGGLAAKVSKTSLTTTVKHQAQEVSPGDTFTGSVWVKGANAGSAQLQLRFLDEYLMPKLTASGSAGSVGPAFSQFTIGGVVAPGNAAWVEFVVTLTGTGDMILDSASLDITSAPTATPTTEPPSPTPTPTDEGPTATQPPATGSAIPTGGATSTATATATAKDGDTHEDADRDAHTVSDARAHSDTDADATKSGGRNPDGSSSDLNADDPGRFGIWRTPRERRLRDHPGGKARLLGEVRRHDDSDRRGGARLLLRVHRFGNELHKVALPGCERGGRRLVCRRRDGARDWRQRFGTDQLVRQRRRFRESALAGREHRERVLRMERSGN